MNDELQRRQSLQALCELAGRNAAGWGPDAGRYGSAAPAGAAALPRRNRLLKAGLVGASSLLALAVVAAQFQGEPARESAALPAVVPQAAPLPSPAPVAAAPAEPVRWQDDDLVVDLDQVPLQQAVGLLAHATQTTLSGVQLLQQTAPVTLHARFGDALSAWQHLLQGRARFSVGCGASSCRVSVTGEEAPADATAAPQAERMPPGSEAVPAGKAHNATESQPDGSC